MDPVRTNRTHREEQIDAGPTVRTTLIVAVSCLAVLILGGLVFTVSAATATHRRAHERGIARLAALEPTPAARTPDSNSAPHRTEDRVPPVKTTVANVERGGDHRNAGLPTARPTGRGRPAPSASSPASPHRNRPVNPAPTLAAEPHSLRNRGTGHCFDTMPNGSLFSMRCKDVPSQRWRPMAEGSTVYQWRNEATRTCLTGDSSGIHSASCDSSDRRQGWSWNGSSSSAEMVHASNGRCLVDSKDGTTTTSPCNGSDIQRWRIE